MSGQNLQKSSTSRWGTRIRIGSFSSSSAGIPHRRSTSAPGTVADGVSTDNAVVVNSNWYTDQYGGKNEWTQVNVIVKDVDDISDIESAIDDKVNTNAKTPSVRITDAPSHSQQRRQH